MPFPGLRFGLLSIVLLPALATAQPVDEARVRDAVTRGYRAIQAAQKASRTSQSCTTTCHLQLNGTFAYRAIRQHRIPLDEQVARADFDRAFRRFATDLSTAVESNSLGEVAMNQAFMLVAAHEIGLKPNVVTGALARAVALKQNPGGDWTALGERPPSNHSGFTFTALGLRALQLYGHEREKAAMALRITRAKSWLQGHVAKDTEGRTFQLLGLLWAGEDRAALAPLAKALADTQRADGGWHSLAGRESDVYSTGQALVALHEAGGMSIGEAVWRRGLEFLLRTQAGDGTWHVRTRLPPWVSPPYYESGYPYGRDQFISTAGANWAIRALTHALGSPARLENLPLDSLNAESIEPWVATAMFGTASELKQLLEGSLSADAVTGAGRTSLLMLAVPDADKVRLLLERGATVDAVSRQRYSALLVAAQYPEANDVSRLLLARGARAAPAGGNKPAANAYPTFVAAHGGNTDILAELQRAGDKLDDSVVMFGVVPVSPLGVAALYNHLETARALIKLGARPDPADIQTDTPLVSAVLANHLEMAELLVASGANINRADERGMTPLMYAAVTDFGDSSIVDLLLRSGARTDVRDSQGRTAADYARQYGHQHLLARLSP